MSRARYVMIGGFLGAGKTTAMLRLARMLSDRGMRVGLITNDQSVGLVDTALLAAHGFPVEEITGGCFCCRFNSLVDAADKLTAATRPDVFLAEPVGSCTDLMATVSYPLRRLYGDDYEVAPLSVVLDPVRARRVLGLDPGPAFSEKVRYIYLKQIEESEIVVVNKVDLLDAERLDELLTALAARFPGKGLLSVSARDGTGLDQWLGAILGGEAARARAMEVDYDVYADGEALLGWLNCSATVEGDDEFDGNGLLRTLAHDIRAGLIAARAEVAHCKMTLAPDEGHDLAVLNLVRNDQTAEMSHTLQEPLTSGALILNLRAEADPQLLRGVVEKALAATGPRVTVLHLEHFRPGRPTPTHRLAGA